MSNRVRYGSCNLVERHFGPEPSIVVLCVRVKHKTNKYYSIPVQKHQMGAVTAVVMLHDQLVWMNSAKFSVKRYHFHSEMNPMTSFRNCTQQQS